MPLRRLYSTFARGWPGAGLLLMRLVAGSALLLRASSTGWSAAPLDATVTSAFVGVSGILLISGLWTPIAGTVVALVAFAQMLARGGDPGVLVFLGTIGGALAMLGPGVWSVDARLFGWKRLEAPPRKSPSKSF